MTDEILQCFELFELEPEASLKDVKQAYREMAKVWHPDRFPNDSKLHAKAQEKLKQINLAYEKLQDFFKNPEAYQSNTDDSEEPEVEQDETEADFEKGTAKEEKKSSPNTSSRIPEEVIQAKFDKNSLLNSRLFGIWIMLASIALIILNFFF